jgi:hypothetical protein
VKEYLNLTDKCPVDSERRVAIHPTDESDGYSRHTIYKRDLECSEEWIIEHTKDAIQGLKAEIRQKIVKWHEKRNRLIPTDAEFRYLIGCIDTAKVVLEIDIDKWFPAFKGGEE